MVSNEACGGDQGQLSGTFTEVTARRPRLVLEWVTTGEDYAVNLEHYRHYTTYV